MIQKHSFIYIMTNKKKGTLYTGVTNNLLTRVWQHKNTLIEGFTKRYSLWILVYFEQYSCTQLAIKREKQIKNWQRKWKLELIEKVNPKWRDLYEDIN